MADAEETKAGEPAKPTAEQLAERNAYLEAEAKKAFASRDEVKARLRELEEADAKRKEAELSETERLKAQLTDSQKKLEAVQAKAKEWETFQSARRESLKTELGDKWDDSFSLLPIDGLEKLARTLAAPKPPGSPKPKDSVTLNSYKDALANSVAMEEFLKLPDEVQAKMKADYYQSR